MLLFGYVFLTANTIAAQDLSDSLKPTKVVLNDSLNVSLGKDALDILRKIFKSKKVATTDSLNWKSKKIYSSIFPVAGYTLQTGFAVLMSGSFAFYTDTVQKKLSNILTSITYTQFNQILFPLAATIWSKNNKYLYGIDYRYLKYPSTTYGIGARTTDNDAYTLNFTCIKFHQSVLRKVSDNLYAGLGFFYDHFWNIKEIDPPVGVHTSYERYGNQKSATAAAIVLKVLYDNRQNPINATNGYYASVVYRPNYTFFGSDNDSKSLQIDIRKYFKINGNPRHVIALWSFDWLTLGKGKQPYFLLPSTGWDDQYNTGRGYVQSRFRARNLIYAEAEYRFGITDNGLLGAVVFVNSQSYSKSLGSQQLNLIAPGFGGGIRIKLNKHSNTNLAIDYGFGLNGAKGLFLNLGEVF